MTRVSIVSQILEVEREISKRRQVYPRLVANRKMRDSEAALLIGRMEAVRDTLLFCQQHEVDIRAYISAKREA